MGPEATWHVPGSGLGIWWLTKAAAPESTFTEQCTAQAAEYVTNATKIPPARYLYRIRATAWKKWHTFPQR